MDNIILSQIPLNDLLEQVKKAVREELAVRLNNQEPGTGNQKPITTRELCDYLGITEPTVIRLRKKGVIPFIELGSAIRFHLPDVLKALEKGKNKKPGAAHQANKINIQHK